MGYCGHILEGPSCHCRCASLCATSQPMPAETPWPGLSQQRRCGCAGLAEPLLCQAGSLLEYQVLSCAAGCTDSQAELREAPKPQHQAGPGCHSQAPSLGTAGQKQAGSRPGFPASGRSGAWGCNARQRGAPCTWARTSSQHSCPSTASDISKAWDIGTILLSGAASVTALPNSCAREGPLPASHRPRSPEQVKPGARGSCAPSATQSCDMEARGWGPQVLSTCCAGNGITHLQSKCHHKVVFSQPAAPEGNSSQNLTCFLISSLNLFMASLYHLFSCQHCP